MAEPVRCQWVDRQPEIMIRYHDEEWGVPIRDDRLLFEYLCLGAMQAGLNWLIVLKKRPHFRERFFRFDIERCAGMTEEQVEAALRDPGIIRNRLKVNAVRRNAAAALTVIDEFGSLGGHLWSFVDHAPVVNRYRNLSQLPATTPVSDAMSGDLRKRGFTFVGSTICYAFMQAVGMVVDHEVGCFRHRELAALAAGEGARV